MADREPAEVGVELPALTCPKCGKETAKVANPDGSYSAEEHEGCYKPPSKADVERAEKARTEPAETGDEKENS